LSPSAFVINLPHWHDLYCDAAAAADDDDDADGD